MADRKPPTEGPSLALDTPLEMFRELCENAQDLIQSVAADGRLLYVNQAWLDALGYRHENVTGKSVFDFIHPESLDHCQQSFAQVFGGRLLHNVEFSFRARNGRRVEVLGSAGARSVNGKVVSTSGIFHEITETKQHEMERQRLFELSLDLLCVAGLDGYFKQINPQFERALGYAREELLSRPFVDFVHPDDREKTILEVEKLNRGEPTVDFQNRYRASDGRYLWLSWRAAPMTGMGLVFAVARDITREKQTQELMVRQAEMLARSNADLEQFASTASHDLRAPLRGIDHLAEWIEEDMPADTPQKVRDHLQRLRRRVQRMDVLIEDLLRYYRSERLDDHVETVDAKALVEDVAQLVGPPSGFTIIARDDLPTFETAKAPLELVLRNLIANGVKHHDRGNGKVTVSAKKIDGGYEFTVEDDGPGIPPDHLERVFEMFSQLKPRDEVEGSGIGLALVRRIVERYRGRVSAESDGRGTAFHFTWPDQIVAGRELHGPNTDR
jgi:PAS domain S-box-containing protein